MNLLFLIRQRCILDRVLRQRLSVQNFQKWEKQLCWLTEAAQSRKMVSMMR